MNRKEKKFLKKLYKLYKKYNIVIDACGCCDSPFLTHLKHNGQAYQYIRHLENNEAKPKKSFDITSFWIRKMPKPKPVPPTPLKDINKVLDDPELISKIQDKLRPK